MIKDLMELIFKSVSAAFIWFDSIFDKIGAWKYFIFSFLIYTVIRLLILPIAGGLIRAGQSDTVKSIRKSFRKQSSQRSKKHG